MHISSLHGTNFRNLADFSIEFPPEGAILEGLNGVGKTNVLESIYLLCTGRSQRGANRADMITFKQPYSYIEGKFTGEDKKNEVVSIGFGRDKKTVMKLNDQPVKQFSDWFGNRAAISFGADDLMLVYGSPEDRRRFIDLFCSQADPSYLTELISYKRSLKSRNILLEENGDRVQVGIYEEQMAHCGTFLFMKRREILERTAPIFKDIYHEISGSKEFAEVLYEPSIKCDNCSENEWKNVFYRSLKERREKDIAMGFSSVGPHRDDIRFLLNNTPAKTYGSQGQCRSIALSLKLSSIHCLEQYHHDTMIFLIDDAVSELDPERTSRVYPLIEGKGQVFIATPVMSVPIKKDLLRCTVSGGKITTA